MLASILFSVFFNSFQYSVAAVSCVDPRPSLDCLNYLEQKAILLTDASKLCRGGVNVECISYLEKRGVLPFDAANYCKGGVEVECVKKFESKGFLLTDSAKNCSGLL